MVMSELLKENVDFNVRHKSNLKLDLDYVALQNRWFQLFIEDVDFCKTGWIFLNGKKDFNSFCSFNYFDKKTGLVAYSTSDNKTNVLYGMNHTKNFLNSVGEEPFYYRDNNKRTSYLIGYSFNEYGTKTILYIVKFEADQLKKTITINDIDINRFYDKEMIYTQMVQDMLNSIASEWNIVINHSVLEDFKNRLMETFANIKADRRITTKRQYIKRNKEN